MLPRWAALLAVAGTLALAAPAAAQDPVPTPTPPPAPTPAPAPGPAPPAAAKLTLALEGAYGGARRPLVLRGDAFRVTGVLSPAAPGQKVVIRFSHGARKLLARRVAVRPDGRFSLRLRARWRDGVAIRAVHKATPQLSTARAGPIRLTISDTTALASGSSGRVVELFQEALGRMRYPAPRTGVFDAATGRAVMTWRKVNGHARVESADVRVLRAVLRGRGAYRVRHPRLGHHVEADLSRQMLALVDGDRVVRVYPVSSGKPSTPTIMGTFHVYSKTPGTNGLGMVHASYFQGGYAIHGYFSVPAFAASHGCLRVPVPDAWAIFSWLRVGDAVVVEP
jgi:lipoprotein-anchoring transpeptidase ErfK/SrfK